MCILAGAGDPLAAGPLLASPRSYVMQTVTIITSDVKLDGGGRRAAFKSVRLLRRICY